MPIDPLRLGSPSSSDDSADNIGTDDLDEGDNGLTRSGKRKRKRTSPEQLHVLETTFNMEQHPSLGMRNQLATQLNMTPRSVQIWYYS